MTAADHREIAMPDRKENSLQLQVIMPVHNEGSSIAGTLREWYNELSGKLEVEFVISEDGSVDDTKEVLTGLSGEMPLLLDMTDDRRGYAKAVIAAFRATTAPHVLAVDSDGQCDPEDFWNFWGMREEADVVIGWRVKREDTLLRKTMSGSFKLLHRFLFSLKLHDPSCPYLLIRQEVLDRILPELGMLTEGFWWEFVAWAAAAGFRIKETPVNHRNRASGSSVVFQLPLIPRIAIRNVLGLIKVWRQTRHL